MGEWRPIETAPDGEPVIVVPAGGEYNASIAYRLKRDGHWIIPESSRYLTVEPTHWMPLPEPPEARS